MWSNWTGTVCLIELLPPVSWVVAGAPALTGALSHLVEKVLGCFLFFWGLQYLLFWLDCGFWWCFCGWIMPCANYFFFTSWICLPQIKTVTSVFSALLLLPSPSLRRCDYVPPLSTSDLKSLCVHSVCARWVFGDCVVIWAALCCILCGTIHGQCLQMNASIHKCSLSISCSPWCLVVVFSCSLRGEKKAIKMGQKHAGTQVVYLENKKRNKRKWCLQSTHSLFEQSQPNFPSLGCFFIP